jgi:hypothetical protein
MTSVPGSLNPPAYVPCKLTIVTKQVSAYGSRTPRGWVSREESDNGGGTGWSRPGLIEASSI